MKRFEFDEYLGVYPYNTQIYLKWRNLTTFLTPKVVHILEPINKVISGIYEGGDKEMEKISPTPPQSASIQQQHKPYYTAIDKQIPKKGATAEEITKFNFDKSNILTEIMKRYDPGM